MEAYKFEPIESIDHQDEQDLFLSILYHDKRGGNAIRMLLSEGEDGRKPYVCHYASRDINDIGYRSTGHNCYVSINTFRSYKRVSDEVYNYSTIFIDLDGHDLRTEEQLDKALERTKKRLKKAFSSHEISAPTMITETGRGLGIFYILKNSIANTQKSRKSLRYLDQIRAGLTAKYKKILDKKGYLSVDSTVKDPARVCRLPLTFNKKINRWCRLIHVEYDHDEVKYYDLKELDNENHLQDDLRQVKRLIRTSRVVSIDAYKVPFLTIRLQKIELLQKIRKYSCSGYREYMCFIHYNAAKQIYGEVSGAEATKSFNRLFNAPLMDQELEHIFDVVDSNKAPSGDYEGFYKLPDEWIIDTLEVTDEENAICHFGASKRQIIRAQIKEENQRKRQERNAEIAGYIVGHEKSTYKEIAGVFGVSESTVRRIAKDHDIKRYNTAPAENQELNISNDTDFELEHDQNVQNLSQSLLGVPIGEDVRYPALADIVTNYTVLYGQIRDRRRKNHQIKGQISFRGAGNGEIEYYISS